MAYDRETALERFGNPEGLDQAAADFIEEYPALLALARRALARNESRTLLRATAKLSWHLGLLCAPAALEAALALESVGRNENLAEAAPLLDRLEWETQRLQQAFD